MKTMAMKSTMSRVLRAGLKRSVWTSVTIATVLIPPLTAAAESPTPFRASFQGAFTIQFGTGPGGTNELFFAGNGIATHLGRTTVDGHSTTRNTSPVCMEIVTDAVTLTAASGDALRLVNAGEECLDFSVPGKVLILGSGSTQVVGGTGRFAGASGSGRWEVLAEVTHFGAGSASGLFTLTFVAAISR